MIILIPLAFYFIASVSCLPFFTSFFNKECASLIQHELDLSQGLHPDKTNPANFGYIYRLTTPSLNMGPDMSLVRTEGLPSQAAVILSSFTLDESNAKLTVRGRISKLNADRLLRVTRKEKDEEEMNIQFNLFGLDRASQRFHSMLGSHIGEMNGIVNTMNVIEQKNGQDEYQELVLELRPSKDEYLEYSDSPASSVKQLVWSSQQKKSPCSSTTQKRDRFHEIIDSAVLL